MTTIHLTRRAAIAAAVGLGAASAARRLSAASSQQELDVIAFPGGFNLPLWAAAANGAFERHGIKVNLHYTPDSVSQMKGLLDGSYDIAMTAMDNVVAYHEGQGAVRSPNERQLRAFLGVDDGLLSLVVAREIKDFAGLRGRTLAVDALTTGYSFVLMELLARHGLSLSDVSLKSFGGVANRWDTLRQGAHAGTLLVTPFELVAQAEGFHLLAYAREFTGAYQGVVAAALRPSIEAQGAAFQAFANACDEAVRWLRTPDSKSAALRILGERMPQVAPEMLPAMHAALLAGKHGLSSTSDLNLAGVRTVLDLRRKYGPAGARLADADAYVMRVNSG